MKGNPLCHYKNDIKIDFLVSKKTNLYKTRLKRPIYPIFNNDDKYFTPGFILPMI
jgi:hypothetical protein